MHGGPSLSTFDQGLMDPHVVPLAPEIELFRSRFPRSLILIYAGGGWSPEGPDDLANDVGKRYICTAKMKHKRADMERLRAGTLTEM